MMMRMVRAHLSEYHYREDALRGTGWQREGRLFSPADRAADCRFAAPRRDAGKNGAKPRARRGAGSVSCDGNHDGALRARGFRLAAEFAGGSDCELFCVPVTDCVAHSIFSRGRKAVRCATSAAFRHADFGYGSCQFLGRNAILVDDDVARDCRLVFGGADFCGIGLRDSCAAFAARAANVS